MENVQIIVYLHSRVIDNKAITRTDSSEKTFTVVIKQWRGANTPWDVNFGSKTTLRPSPGRKDISWKISLHLLVPCRNA